VTWENLGEDILETFVEAQARTDQDWRGLEVWPARRLGFPQRLLDPVGQREASQRWRRSARGRRMELARHRVWRKTELGRAASRRGVAKWRAKPENRAKRNEQRRRAYAAKKELARGEN
jgi:hypothetical protein